MSMYGKKIQRITLEKIPALKKKFGFHYILDPFKFEVAYLTRNLTCLLYPAILLQGEIGKFNFHGII
jgi:hypothetical protein